jgi:trehalose-6-phosphate synthase
MSGIETHGRVVGATGRNVLAELDQRVLMPDVSDKSVVAVANRLPVRHGDDGWELSPGGLVTALRPVMENRTGAWVGWDGGTKGAPETLPASQTRLLPIGLPAAQVRQYYHGFANATLWPLLHDAIERPRFERSWWRSYQDVNVTFADATVAALADYQDALAWVHDYHLTLMPGLIRARLAGQPIGFFLHIPWPAPEIFARVPWRQEILLGMLGADVISFHAERYRDNFCRSCARLRLDYSKGIVERLLAVEALLDRRPDLRSTIAFLQVAVPSRDKSRSTAASGRRSKATSAGSTAGSPSPARTYPCTTCIAPCHPVSSLRTTRSLT